MAMTTHVHLYTSLHLSHSHSQFRDFVTLVRSRKAGASSRSGGIATTRAASLTSGVQGSTREQLLAKLNPKRNTNDFSNTRDGSYGTKNQHDFDVPTRGFNSIPEAVEDIRQGKMVIVVDDEGRENEGDLIMAASKATPDALSFIVKHGTGIVCVSMKSDHLERLQLPLMVPPQRNKDILGTAFTITVDAKHGTTTGVSAEDRATTILALASHDSTPQHFNRPGHIFPLRYTDRGVLARPGHTEASADLAILAGLEPVAVLTEIVDDDGSMARLPRLKEFAKEHDLKIVSIFDMIRYLKKREETVKLVAAARMPTMLGNFKAHCYESLLDGVEHIAMVKGEIGDGENVLVRIQSECLANDIFGSNVCDCGGQLDDAMKQIEEAGRGVLVYIRGHKGREIDLGIKLPSFVTDPSKLGAKEYDVAAKILRDLGVGSIKLISDSTSQYNELQGYGFPIVETVPLCSPIPEENSNYKEAQELLINMGLSVV